MRDDQTFVVVVEDHKAQQEVLTAAFQARGYQVHVAGTGAEALSIVDTTDPDLIVLDLGLPDLDGLVLCKHLRARTPCPIIVVTADADERRVVEALDAGADDYVTKPFSMSVLLARSRVALRHRASAAAVVDEQVLAAGDIQLDLSGYQLMVAGEVVELGTRQFELLAILVRNRDKVVTYAALDRALGTNRAIDERNPWRVSISKIRKQLGVGPQRPIVHTELRVGYRLVVPDEPRLIRWVVVGGRICLDALLGEGEEGDDDQDRSGDEQDLVPSALMGEDDGGQHGNGSYGFAG